ncbi:uncharacterized protein LOC116613084 isoform X4 [Nematostella vectensis]|uniref:uncharacterized protein LOC116613084 isoform X4 n=1 Tax=Nematostella vectensis TaxID=45351 RepID=UPI002076F415|nr:uncharacterized protein LOC116613084 isoform X4 [Nematostella vectensis]
MIATTLQWLVFSALCAQVVFCATKQWIPNTNWDNPANWAPGKVPCPQQNVFLGSRLSAKPLAIALSSDASVHSLNLPMTGELVFYNNAELSLTQDINTIFKSCPDKGDIQFVASDAKAWYDPDNWREVEDGGAAIPEPANSALHLEQVPCVQDSASFPWGSTFNVKSDGPINIASVTVNGKHFTRTQEFRNYYTSESGSLQFKLSKTDISLSNEPCTDPAGCICGNERVRDKVCKFVSCEPTRCDSPLDPDGSCCSVCGALIKLKYTEGFKLRDFKKKVLKIFSEENNDKNRRALKEDTSVELSISRIEGDQVQVVLTDNENGKKAQAVAEEIEKVLLEDENLKSVKLLQSGRRNADKDKGTGSSVGWALGLGLGLLLLFIFAVAFLVWRRKRMRSHSLSLIEEDRNGDVEMKEVEQNGGIDNPAMETPEPQVRESGNLLYVGKDEANLTNFSNPLYESADTRAI